MADSVFDPQSFMETQFAGNLDTSYVNVPPGEGLAQISGVKLSQIDFPNIGGSGVRCELTWKLVEGSPFFAEAVATTGMKEPTVSQQFLLDGDVVDGRFKLDLGVNKNMRLKHVVEATGLNKSKHWNFGSLTHQTAHVKVEHSAMIDKAKQPLLDDDGKPRFRAEVTRVTSIDKARAKAAA